MKIRYYHKDKPGTRYTTKEFNPDGTATGKFRLAIERDGEYLTGKALLAELQKPIYPDVPFSIRLPLVRVPRSHSAFVYVDEPQHDGTIIKKKVWSEVWDVTREEYEGALAAFTAHLAQYLTVCQIYSLPDIPDGDGYIWEQVDMTKPYRDRYTKIPIEKGKYRGDVVRPVDGKEWVFGYFAASYGQSRNPLKGITNRIV